MTLLSTLQKLLDAIQENESTIREVIEGGDAVEDKEREYSRSFDIIQDISNNLQRQGIYIRNPNVHQSLWELKRFSTLTRRPYVLALYSELVSRVRSVVVSFKKAYPTDDELAGALRAEFGSDLIHGSQSSDNIIELLNTTASSFRHDHSDPHKCAFIMMSFAHSNKHHEIVAAIKSKLAALGMEGLRADDKEYHFDLYQNMLTYLHECRFGIAVFDAQEGEQFNPNVAFEAGYMLALGKPVCLLKESGVRALQADLMGKLYREFDGNKVSDTIPVELERWLLDKGLTA